MKGDAIPLAADRYAVCRLTEAAETALLKLLFSRYPYREWGTFFRFGFRHTSWGIALSFVDTLPPGPDDLDRQSGIVEFRPAYIRRALRTVAGESLGLGVIHSHPLGSATWPSSLDDDMDSYFAELLAPYTGSRPYLSLIVSRDAAGRLSFSGRIAVEGQWLPVRFLHTIGLHQTRRLISQTEHEERVSVPDSPEEESTIARLESTLGSPATQRLRGAKVAILGCSGTGSPTAEVLARAGVESFLLVDYQRFGRSNLERMHGSTYQHAQMRTPSHKVMIIADLIRSINPRAKIVTVIGNLLDEAVLDELLNCDLVLNCTDTEHSRAALGDFGNHYLLPFFDVAVLMEGREGQLTSELVEFCYYGPGLPCAFCDRRINQHRLTYELLTEEERQQKRDAAAAAVARGLDGNQYWAGEPAQVLTVGHLTTTAGGLLAGYAIGYLTGSSRSPASRFQIDLLSLGFGFVSARRQAAPTCSCIHAQGHADQARANRAISRPLHWPAPEIRVIPAPDEAQSDCSCSGQAMQWPLV